VHVLLDHDATSHGLDRAVENRDKAVAGRFDQPPVMLGNAGLDQVALDSLDAPMRALLIELHEAAVACDIAGNDRGKAARSEYPRRPGGP
jgi:hypothetical protein